MGTLLSSSPPGEPDARAGNGGGAGSHQGGGARPCADGETTQVSTGGLAWRGEMRGIASRQDTFSWLTSDVCRQTQRVRSFIFGVYKLSIIYTLICWYWWILHCRNLIFTGATKRGMPAESWPKSRRGRKNCVKSRKTWHLAFTCLCTGKASKANRW